MARGAPTAGATHQLFKRLRCAREHFLQLRAGPILLVVATPESVTAALKAMLPMSSSEWQSVMAKNARPRVLDFQKFDGWPRQSGHRAPCIFELFELIVWFRIVISQMLFLYNDSNFSA